MNALGTVVGLANHTILIARDGRETAIDDSGAPILDDDGKLIGIVLVFRNIEDKRSAERERERIAEQLAQVLEATTDAIVSVNRGWRLTYLNPRAKQLYAAEREVLGLTLWDAFPEAAHEGSPYAEHFNRAMREGISSVFEAEYPTAEFAVAGGSVPARDGIVISLSRDISQEEADREALRHKSEETERQRAEIETLYRTAPIGLALFDTEDFGSAAQRIARRNFLDCGRTRWWGGR